jgi:transcriptional regulator with XRE-family HTH domain
MEIGNTLRDARESRGISLEEAEENTKIRRKYLQALEREDFDLLPGRVYAKAFIKNYAIFLGLRHTELVSAYEKRIPLIEKDDDMVEKPLTRIEKPGGRILSRVLLTLTALILVAGVYIYWPSFDMTGQTAPPAGEEYNIAAGEKNGQERVESKPAAQTGVKLVINVTDNRSWVYVEVDGKPAFTGTVPKGQMKEFEGDEKIFLKLGNAGVVEVEVNGEKMGVLGNPGQVVTRVFMAPQG